LERQELLYRALVTDQLLEAHGAPAAHLHLQSGLG
jgi:hypothetical protein